MCLPRYLGSSAILKWRLAVALWPDKETDIHRDGYWQNQREARNAVVEERGCGLRRIRPHPPLPRLPPACGGG